MEGLREHYAKWNKSDKEWKVIWYHSYMEPKKYSKIVNVTEKKQTHRSISSLYSEVGKDWGWKENGATDDEMVGWNTSSVDMSLIKLQEIVKDKEAWRAAVHGVTKSWMWLLSWTTTNRTNEGLPVALSGAGYMGRQVGDRNYWI